MLPCVCSVIDHRWRQNVVRTKKWHTRRSQVCHWCSYHILTSSVIYYWIYYWSLFYFKIFQHNAKAGLLPRLCPAFARKKAIWRDLWSIENEAISLVAMRSRELWLVEKNHAHCQTWRERRPSLNKNLQRKQNWTAKKILEKSSQVLSSEQPREPESLDVALKITGVEKIPHSENLWLRST